ncbi:MAG: histidine phosphatase family protein, partial [Armatimonadota bacterium]
MLKSLTLVRHGESQWNAGRRIQGQLESDLSPLGRMQARALRRLLDKENFAAVFSSDLVRAADTALLATGWPPDEIDVTPDLREISFGHWQGLSPEEVHELWPNEWEAFRKDPINCRPESGESIEQLQQRLRRCTAMWHKEYPGMHVIAFSHGGPVRLSILDILGMPYELWRALRVSNTGVSRIDFTENGPVLASFNNT